MVETFCSIKSWMALATFALARGDDVGVRRECALHVIKGREQRLRRFPRFARDDTDALPLRAGIKEIDGACRALACDLDAGDLVPDLERQIELDRGLARARADRVGGFAERLATAGERLDHSRARSLGAAQDAGGELAAFAGALSERKRGVIPLGAKHGNAAGGAGKLGKNAGEGFAFAVVQTVGEPQHAIAGLPAKLFVEHLRQARRGRARKARG